jgi:protein tyrosine phosphatase (PTP) superfamily phosphohydrolase (DUF442 family)
MTALEDIRDFRRISSRLATAGQPTAEQFAAIAAAGFEVVINLLPVDSERALPDEAQRVRALGMGYVHLPVDWEHPTDSDFGRFADTLRRYRDRCLLIHCAANLRVSSFLALYRKIHEGWAWSAADAEMRTVWEPNPIWSSFIRRILRSRESRANPWRRIALVDYEVHMGPGGADQLDSLSAVLGRHCRRIRPARIAVLGCAAGNGFEQIDPVRVGRLIGIDFHHDYLRAARARFPQWGSRLQLICARAEACALRRGSLDLVSAGLIFEYCDPAELAASATELIAPGGYLSVVLQLPSRPGTRLVSATERDSLRELESIMQLVPPDELERLLRERGVTLVEHEEIPLPFGKSFYAGLFRKRARCGGGRWSSWRTAKDE